MIRFAGGDLRCMVTVLPMKIAVRGHGKETLARVRESKKYRRTWCMSTNL